MAATIINALASDNASKHIPSALTAREERTLYRAMGILETHFKRPDSETLSGTSAVRAYLTLKLAREEREQFVVLFLNAQHRLIEAETMFYGTLSETSVYPREVVKRALQHNAAAVILAHNHPSGALAPSQADQILTDALKQALALVDVRVLDHFIVAGCDTLSFAERGMMDGKPAQSEEGEVVKQKTRKPRAKTKAVRARPSVGSAVVVAHV